MWPIEGSWAAQGGSGGVYRLLGGLGRSVRCGLAVDLWMPGAF